MKHYGSQVDGTFCEHTVSYVDHITPIPDALDSAQAAGIMCAGFTAYSALKQSEAHIGNWVAIPGAGGGLGHLGQLVNTLNLIYPYLKCVYCLSRRAIAMGLRVVAIDTGEGKRKLCLELGAEKWIDFRESTDLVAEVIAATKGGVHAAIVISGGVRACEQAWSYLRRRG
ncbi:hypothetical protein EW145_g3788 [Phellinidium pouzarii]|uniref:Alcohol dehydrogenase-like C-terminal domain-containing protein n=1 Tax=Phellinidium pouzarii TaxID=167371 RepID=A0A4S4L5V8_9AGAM|nr:hypothetical protein EW145_g3788 [Phellinidium pouzarii]